MIIVGRKEEKQILTDISQSKRPEFLIVYGRRRVGKTYLIKEFFNHDFSFYSSGILNANMDNQLKAFNNSLIEYGSTETKKPKNWFEAFNRLKHLIEDTDKKDLVTGKKIIFLDEVPWMDTKKSDFKSALDYFWNTYASSNPDILLIVCGSATSWIIDNILTDTGGFYKRVTRTLKIEPFHLKECEELFKINEIEISRSDITLCYMIFGGIPYYLNLFNRRLSVVQNINELLFKESGALHFEYDMLFSSLFKNHDNYMRVIEKIAADKNGITRNEIIDDDIQSGSTLTKILKELEQCGFIRKYNNFTKKEKECIYQLIDPFTMFCIKMIKTNDITDWNIFYDTPKFYSWSGNAFEILCLNHINKIKTALNIYGVQSVEYAFRSKKNKGGCQIDLLIDRKDNVINLCEMKYTLKPYEIDYKYENELLNKINVFKEESKTKKAIFLTVISYSGIKHNEYSNIVVNEINGDDLF